MRAYLFRAGGALTEEHAPIYVERQADHEMLTQLQAMDYLLVIEPRQQGKTSLVNHLMRHPTLNNITFVYIDVTTPDRSTEESWYQSLCTRILRQLRNFIPRDRWPDIPQHSAGWRDFLSDVAFCAIEANQRVVIALDEIGAVTFPQATAFFSVLRDVYNSRQAEAEFKHLTFWLVGAFHPRDLIKDDKISPFNIAYRVHLPDFSLTQVRELVSKGDWPDKQVTVLAERIHYWTDGQPYLTQLLCSYLGPTPTPTDVNAGIERLRREDENHLPPLLERLQADPKLREYVAKIRAGERIKFYPRENRRQAQLELLGILKADDQGYCTIRNHIYELALLETNTPHVNPVRSKPVKELPMDKPDPYADLRNNLKNSNVVAFVGAGLSVGAGLPGWYQLLSELSQRIGYELPPVQWAMSDALIEAAQAYINDRGLHNLVMFLKDKLDTTHKTPTAAHQALARLPISLVLTANYDDLLERAFRDAGRRVQAVVQDKDIPFMRREPGAVNIVKLYGDLNQPDTIVLARQQYENFFLQRPQMIKLLETELARSDVLYLGWSHTDPHFNLVFGEMLHRFGQFMRSGYAVMFDLPDALRKELERKHIRLVQLSTQDDRTEQLAIWLNGLADGGADVRNEEKDSIPVNILTAPSTPPAVALVTNLPKPTRPTVERVEGDGQLRYERGLEELGKCFKLIGGPDLEEFQDYSRQLLANVQEEQRYGGDSHLTRERNKITGNLNRLTMRVLGESFNDFALGKLKCSGTATTRDPVMSKLEAIHVEVKQQGEETRKSISTLRQDILGSFDATGRQIIGEVVAELTRSQARTVQQVIAALDQGVGNDGELQDTLTNITHTLGLMQQQLAQIDTPALNEATQEILAVLSEPEMSARHKLKLTVPLIPLLLDYEGELELGQSVDLEAAWLALKKKLGLDGK